MSVFCCRSEAKDNLQQAVTYELPDIMVHASKLDQYITFLPGQLDVGLGNLLKCNGEAQGNSISELRHTIPTSKAIFLHKSKCLDEGGLGAVLSLAFLPNGDLVVLVSSGKKIRIYNTRGDKAGKLRYDFGEDEELLHPTDLVVTKDGEIAIADSGYLSVKVFDSFGSRSHYFGGEDVFEVPVSITQDDLGRFLVLDQGKKHVSVHRQNGEHLMNLAVQELPKPQLICCQNNKTFICDVENKIIGVYAYNKEGMTYIARMTTPTTGMGEFLDCSGITMDRNGHLFVSDMFLDRIHVFNVYGEMSSITARGRQFLRPTCMANSMDGLLAVAQRGIDMDGEQPPQTDVCVYRLVRADI